MWFLSSVVCLYLVLNSGYVRPDKQQNTSKYALTEVVAKYGYPVETHEIETEDGYLLDVYRVPYGGSSIRRQPNKHPVILFHGLFGTAETYIIGGPKKALAYMLADSGYYDVWLLNARGSWHSRKHKTLNPDKDNEFWKFTIHEIGYYDITATIEHITKVTGAQRMHYIGHSQGTTSFFAMAASRPEYNKRIKLMVALSPSAIMRNVSHPIVKLAIPLYQTLRGLLETLGIYELFPSRGGLRCFMRKLCTNSLDICLKILFLPTGFEREQLDLLTIPLIVSTVPAGISTFQLYHYSQIISKGDFYQFDWGTKENLRRYGKPEAPKYDLRKVAAPVALVYGDADVFITEEDVLALSMILPNVVDLYEVPYRGWTHNDFIWAKDLALYVNNHVLEVMKKFIE